MSGWEEEWMKNSYAVYPKEGGGDEGTGDIKYHIEEALGLLGDQPVGNFELIQVEVKLKEALAWMKEARQP